MLTIKPAESGYFSEPTNTLDPYLFEGLHLKPNVRTRLVDTLLDYLDTRYSGASIWTRVWLAGSGISYQWSAARGNGDLDVLFGISYDEFVDFNPYYGYYSKEEIAEFIDNDLRANLWPQTAHISFPLTDDDLYNYNFYEVTFFLNPGVEDHLNDIVKIHPYAAYDLTADQWTTEPAKPGSSVFQHPESYAQQADRNLETANMLVRRYNSLSDMLTGPQEVNQQRSKALVRTEAQNLLDYIHTARRSAFSESGEGYGDFYNYQWQRAKQDGIVVALNKIINGE